MNQEWLNQKYVIEQLSMAAIANLAKCSTPTVQNYLKKFGIPTRSVSQALKGRKLSNEHKAKVTHNLTKANQDRRINGVSKEEKNRLASVRPSMKGKQHSEETKLQMSQTHQGKVMSEDACKRMSEARKGRFAGKNHPLYGHQREDMQGENNPNWNGGITPLYKQVRELRQYKEWRQACFERDDYTCQKCQTTKGPFQVDHIIQFSILLFDHQITSIPAAVDCKQLWNVDNGRTLCISCHEATDSFAGRGKQLLLKHIVQQNLK